MEDHSLEGYLQRRTTEELRAMILYCRDIDRDTLDLIYQLLSEREQHPAE